MEPSLYLHFLLQSHLSIAEMAVAFIAAPQLGEGLCDSVSSQV